MLKSAQLRWAILLGVALGGFFDGILLHQILQWHHLLSLVPGMDDLRQQVLWDGYFHALMYLLAAVGVVGLLRAREKHGARAIGAALLAGFGLWQFIDVVIFHWLARIHRVRLDTAPLAWELVWLAAFGVIPLAAALMFRRKGGDPPAGRRTLAGLAALVFAAGAWAVQPPKSQPFTTIVFRADMSAAQILSALDAAQARLVWTQTGAGVVVAEVPRNSRLALYSRGALLVSGAGSPASCLNWSRT